MTAKIIDGKALAQDTRQEIKQRVSQISKNQRVPCLAVVLVGENPASAVYVRNKIKACEEVGIKSLFEKLPAETSEKDLLSRIDRLNKDDTVDGILVQLPLPKQISEQKVIEAIRVDKDVDGFHLINVGALASGLDGFRPCTPSGVMRMLESINYPLSGKHALVIGRSNIVGKPMALMLLEKNATVTIAHSKTVNLKELAKASDIIVVATGRQKTLTADMVKPDAVVIDVGINRDAQGKLCGDVDTEAVMQIAGHITPVPGGVGPMTIAMLLVNTLQAYERKFKD